MDVRQVVPRDAIPSVDDPEFGPDYGGAPADEVIALTVEGGRDARVPPPGSPLPRGGQRPRRGPLGRRHVVPDLWERRRLRTGRRGRTVEFGVSGKLADDDLVLYDRETGSEWKQSSGVCIAGEFEGRELTVLSAPVVTYEQFRAATPDTPVLRPPGGESEAAGEGREWDRADLAPKAVVLGLTVGEEAVGFPLKWQDDHGPDAFWSGGAGDDR